MSRELGEPSGFHENQSPKKETVSSEKKRGSIFEFIRKKMPILENRDERPPEAAHETEDSEEDDEKDAIGGRWLKTLRKKFRGEVLFAPVAAEGEKDSKAETTEDDPDTHSSLASIFLSEPTPVEMPQTNLFHEEQPVTMPETPAPQPENMQPDNKPTVEVDKDVEEAVVGEESNDISLPESPEAVEQSNPAPEIADHVAAEEDSPQENDHHTGFGAVAGIPGLAQRAAEMPIQPSIETPENTPIKSLRTGGNAAVPILGLGLAYEHHRISKLRRESEKQQKEAENVAKAQSERIAQLNTEQQRQAAIQFEQAAQAARMEAASRDEKQKSESIPEKRAETKPTPVIPEKELRKPEAKAQQVPSPEVPKETKSPETKPEKIPSVGEIIAERSPIPKDKTEIARAPRLPEIPEVPNVTYLNPDEILKPDLREKSSELVFQQVEAAAEQDIALESQYELRHEVKDVATGPTSGGSTAFAVGSSLQEMSNNSHELAKSVAAEAFKSDNPKVGQKDSRNPLAESYKQAMWSGLWGAIVILVAVGVWALLT